MTTFSYLSSRVLQRYAPVLQAFYTLLLHNSDHEIAHESRETAAPNLATPRVYSNHHHNISPLSQRREREMGQRPKVTRIP